MRRDVKSSEGGMKDKLKGENPSTRYSELKHLSNCLKKSQARACSLEGFAGALMGHFGGVRPAAADGDMFLERGGKAG